MWGLFASSARKQPPHTHFHGHSQRRLIETHIKAHPEQVTILHPAHPLHGQTFPVLHQSQDEVLIQVSAVEQRLIALDWTDQVASPATLAGARFLLDHLITVRHRLDALSHTRPYSGTMPPQEDRQLEGGIHGKTRSVHLDPLVPGTTCPSDRPFSADDPTPTQPDKGGQAR
jgi:hypothetical protein